MFVEVNEIGRYTINGKNVSVIEGKILINTEQIRCISISGFDWLDKDKLLVNYDTIRYCIYFDKDRYVYTDIESYNKIKECVITNNIYTDEQIC